MNAAGTASLSGLSDPEKYAEACRRFDRLNAEDPQMEPCEEGMRPRELVYAERLNGWVLKLAPNASEALRLAARCQHLRRWMIPRGRYPLTRSGYLEWRTTLKQFHAEQAADVLREVGYPESIIARVRELNLKRNLASDPEMQVLEDALCLVFLEWQFGPLARKMDEAKTVNALRKSWRKMSPSARAEALQLSYGAHERALIARALNEDGAEESPA